MPLTPEKNSLQIVVLFGNALSHCAGMAELFVENDNCSGNMSIPWRIAVKVYN